MFRTRDARPWSTSILTATSSRLQALCLCFLMIVCGASASAQLTQTRISDTEFLNSDFETIASHSGGSFAFTDSDPETGSYRRVGVELGPGGDGDALPLRPEELGREFLLQFGKE